MGERFATADRGWRRPQGHRRAAVVEGQETESPAALRRATRCDRIASVSDSAVFYTETEIRSYLPTGWVLLALAAWGVIVWPGLRIIHREVQNVPAGEPGTA